MGNTAPEAAFMEQTTSARISSTLADNVSGIADRMCGVVDQGNYMSEVEILSIASQTNRLALNASIEAARADGEK